MVVLSMCGTHESRGANWTGRSRAMVLKLKLISPPPVNIGPTIIYCRTSSNFISCSFYRRRRILCNPGGTATTSSSGARWPTPPAPRSFRCASCCEALLPLYFLMFSASFELRAKANKKIGREVNMIHKKAGCSFQVNSSQFCMDILSERNNTYYSFGFLVCPDLKETKYFLQIFNFIDKNMFGKICRHGACFLLQNWYQPHPHLTPIYFDRCHKSNADLGLTFTYLPYLHCYGRSGILSSFLAFEQTTTRNVVFSIFPRVVIIYDHSDFLIYKTSWLRGHRFSGVCYRCKHLILPTRLDLAECISMLNIPLSPFSQCLNCPVIECIPLCNVLLAY